ncbi:MAG: sigma-70 family RNA polymerase sigma factor [Verrucomicrobiota bacterium]
MANNSKADDDDFEEKLRLAQVPVLGYLIRLTGNVEDAHDLLQATNVTAWEKRDQFEAGSSMNAWMRAIARNHYRNHVDKVKRRPTVPLLEFDLEAMVETRNEERSREETRKRRLLHLCIADLPDRQRSFIEAFYLHEKTLIEVAEEGGIKPNAVAQLLHRARQNLIKCVRHKAHADLSELSEFETDNFSPPEQ